MQIQQQIGPYSVIREERRHGGLITYFAQDSQQQPVLLQTLDASVTWEIPGPFIDELRKFSHPRALRVFDAARTANQHSYLVAEYVQGISLWDRCSFTSGFLTTTRRLPVDRAMEVLRQVAHALDALHMAGLVHGAVEPGAILLFSAEDIAARPEHAFVGASGGKPEASGPVEAKLANLGISLISGGRVQALRHAVAMDTLSPEVIAGRSFTHHSDQFSLGAVAYWMLAGDKPFGDESSRRFPEDAFPGDEALGALRPEIRAVLQKAMAESPQDRYATCLEFTEQLSAAAMKPAAPKSALRADRIVAAEYIAPQEISAKGFVKDIAYNWLLIAIRGVLVFVLVAAGVYALRFIGWLKDYIATP